MERVKSVLGFPARAAGALVRIVGRVAIGSLGFVLMGGGLLLISPLDRAWLGVPLFLLGLLLLVKAIF
jgi:hypothetical protein